MLYHFKKGQLIVLDFIPAQEYNKNVGGIYGIHNIYRGG
jgi:hypothetical protein